MNNRLLFENQRKRLKKPLWLLICFAMFTFWQMGFIYFMGPSLNIDGRTPLPVSMDNITAIIALAYVLCIAFMIFLPRFVIWAERIVLCLALLTVIGLFFPVGEEALLLFIYAHVFFCCFIIGFESFTIINFFYRKYGDNTSYPCIRRCACSDCGGSKRFFTHNIPRFQDSYGYRGFRRFVLFYKNAGKFRSLPAIC